VKFLRRVYVAANLTIPPKPKPERWERLRVLKNFALELGLDPDRIIWDGAFSEPHRFVLDPEGAQARVLVRAIKEGLKREWLAELLPHLPEDLMLRGGGAAGI
jgi:hypothetical protein